MFDRSKVFHLRFRLNNAVKSEDEVQRLDYDYERKASCSQSSGDRRDTNQAECLTAEGFLCDWTREDNGTVWDSCRLYAEEGIAKNVFQCIDTNVSFD